MLVKLLVTSKRWIIAGMVDFEDKVLAWEDYRSYKIKYEDESATFAEIHERKNKSRLSI